jgi:hypothetical protein
VIPAKKSMKSRKKRGTFFVATATEAVLGGQAADFAGGSLTPRIDPKQRIR